LKNREWLFSRTIRTRQLPISYFAADKRTRRLSYEI